MIIYIVTITTNPQSGPNIVAVFTDKEKAKKRYEQEKKSWGESIYIEMWDSESGEEI